MGKRKARKQKMVEQLDNPPFCPASPAMRRYLKRQNSKARRRDWKMNGEDALKKNRYRGWES